MDLKDELMLALHNLVKLKEHKDEKGKDEFYVQNQPSVWKYAKHILEKCVGKNPPENGGLHIPCVSDTVCYMTTCGYNKMNECTSGNREKCTSLQTGH
jgi:hypothetical protein